MVQLWTQLRVLCARFSFRRVSVYRRLDKAILLGFCRICRKRFRRVSLPVRLLHDGARDYYQPEKEDLVLSTIMNEDSPGVVWFGFLIVACIIWGVSHWLNTSDSTSPLDTSSSYSSPNCEEPENPYTPGTGHYAGWEWGEEGNYCDGNSESFIEGCEEYDQAETDYFDCL